MADKSITVYNDLTNQDRTWIGAACLRTAKVLEDLAKRATDAGLAKDAARYQQQAEAVKTDLLARTLHQPLQLGPAERRIVEAGLRILMKNYRAAAGTVLALGESALAEDFRGKAQQIEDVLLPDFADQLSLPISSARAEAE